LEANLEARKARHKKVFAGARTWTKVFSPLNFFAPAKDAELVKAAKRVSKLSQSARLFRSYGVAVTAVFIIGAINPVSAYSHNSFYSPSLEGVEDYYGSDNLLIASDDGYIAKINPQTELSDRTTMNGKLIHEIKSGDTLSTIAQEYGLKTSTVMWENGVTASSKLKVGDTLIIPPVDGVTHVVDKGQDLNKLASLYGVPADSIIKQNQLDSTVALAPGQALFIPGAKPLPDATPAPIVIADKNITITAPDRNTLDRSASDSRLWAANVRKKANVGSTALVSGADIGSNDEAGPSTGKTMIFPTHGVITQYYHPGHYADDIANPSKPPIWAAADGVVVKASSGTWGGGYGNYVIIDHGNGLQTLY